MTVETPSRPPERFDMRRSALPLRRRLTDRIEQFRLSTLDNIDDEVAANLADREVWTDLGEVRLPEADRPE